MPIDSSSTARANGIPVIACQQRDQQLHWDCDLWVVDQCPFCGESHEHGAGEGLRSAHCHGGASGSYYLVRRPA